MKEIKFMMKISKKMRLLGAIAGLSFLTSPLFAQLNGYTFTNTLGTYTPISGGTTVGNSDLQSAVFGADPINPISDVGALTGSYFGTAGFGAPIGFDFKFGARTYTTFQMSTDGYIKVGGIVAADKYPTIVTGSSLPVQFAGSGEDGRDMICAFGSSSPAGGLGGQTGSTMKYITTGTSPNRVCTIEWAGQRRIGVVGDNLNFQIKLYEGSNNFQIVYGTMATAAASTISGTAGAVGRVGTDFKKVGNTLTTTTMDAPVVATTNVVSPFTNERIQWRNGFLPAFGRTYTFNPAGSVTCFMPVKPVFTVNGTQVDISWGAASGATSYNVEYRNVTTSGVFAAAPGGTGLTGTSISVTGLTAANVYEFRVQSNCSGTDWITAIRTIPAQGEICSLAIPYGSVAANAGACTPVTVTAGLGNEGSSSVLCNRVSTSVLSDVWYSFTAPGNGRKIVIETSADGASNPDWAMEVYPSCGGTPLICNDDFSSTDFRPVIELNSANYTAGKTYFIRLMQMNYATPSGPTIKLCVYEDNNCPTPLISSFSDLTFCLGGSVLLSTSGSSFYQWNLNGLAIPGATLPNYSANASGSYTVTTTNGSGCSATSLPTIVTVNTPPAATITAASSTSFCTGGSVVLNANTGTGFTYVWKLNGVAITGATSAIYTANATGSYTVTVTNASNCSASSSATVVTVNTLPTATISAAGTLNICTGGSVTLSAPAVTGQTYVWKYFDVAIAGATANSYTATAAGSYAVTVTSAASAGGCSATSLPSVVTVNAIPAAPTTLTGPSMICTLTSGTYNASAVTGAVSYTWTLPSGLTGTSTTNSIAVAINDLIFTSGAVTVKANTAYCTSTAKSLTIAKVPATPGTLTGSPTVTCGITSGSYSCTGSTGATLYNWILPTGFSGTSTTSSIATVINNATFTTGNISVTAANTCGTSAAKTLALSKVPFTPASISGPTLTCGLTTATYTAAPGNNVSSYTWTLPAGITGTSTTNVISVSIDNSVFVGGNIGVIANNACGISAAKTLAISKVLGASTTLSGPTFICGLTSATYTATAVTGATAYAWALPSGLTGTSTTNSITVAVNPASFTTGSISVSALNACGTGTAKTLALSKIPATPTTITGLAAAVCAGSTQTYSCTAMANAASYTWVVPTGAVINSGQGTTAISVTFPSTFVSGSVTVTANSACGSSVAKALAVAAKTAQPGVITGTSTNLCAAGTYTYSIAAVTGAINYAWTAPAGCTFSGTSTGTSVSLVVPAGFVSGTLSVVANNACGASTARTLALLGAPATPASITGPASVCPSATGLIFSTPTVTGATSYSWAVPSGAIITAGTGTSSITVKWGTVAGSVSVKSTNACGTNATARTYAVALAACRVGEEQAEEASVMVYPNPGKDIFNVRTAGLEGSQLRVTDILGREILSKEVQTNETQVDLSHMPFGTYLFRIDGNNFNKVLKVVRE